MNKTLLSLFCSLFFIGGITTVASECNAQTPSMKQSPLVQVASDKQVNQDPVKIFGEIVFGEDTIGKVKKKLSSKSGCRYDEVFLLGILATKNCYKFPGNPEVTFLAHGRNPSLPIHTISVVVSKPNPLPQCKSKYFSLLKKSWGEPTGFFNDPQGGFTYWEKNGVAITLAGDEQYCKVTYYAPSSWENIKEEIERRKQWEEKPMDTL